MDLILPKPGRYIVAVSGGIDSVCLLDVLSQQQGYELIVAHFDHGIRPEDSATDRQFVADLAASYGLQFVYDEGKLGMAASEEQARAARYAYLNSVRRSFNAEAILTAHHQDDRLETLVINLIRGTGRLGIASIGESGNIKRPLLKLSKQDIKDYALTRSLYWREDSSNEEEKYLRNYVRKRILPFLSPKDKQRLAKLMNRQTELNQAIDQLTSELLSGSDQSKLSLKLFNNLSYNESRELVASWLRKNSLNNFNRGTVERLTLAAKTKRPGSSIDIYGKRKAKLTGDYLALQDIER